MTFFFVISFTNCLKLRKCKIKKLKIVLSLKQNLSLFHRFTIARPRSLNIFVIFLSRNFQKARGNNQKEGTWKTSEVITNHREYFEKTTLNVMTLQPEHWTLSNLTILYDILIDLHYNPSDQGLPIARTLFYNKHFNKSFAIKLWLILLLNPDKELHEYINWRHIPRKQVSLCGE